MYPSRFCRIRLYGGAFIRIGHRHRQSRSERSRSGLHRVSVRGHYSRGRTRVGCHVLRDDVGIGNGHHDGLGRDAHHVA